jgi:signal transduction histidine kinase
MPTPNTLESPERDLTDASLREEREKADREMTAVRLAVERDADAVVEHARENADAVHGCGPRKADEKASEKTDGSTAWKPNPPLHGIGKSRTKPSYDERAAADLSVRSERDARTRMLTRLLPLERDATDQYLLTERARSDDALATRDDFLGMVSHDLRDLLNGIVVSSQFLAQKLEKHTDSEQLLIETARIERYGTRMNRLIGDLVDVASIDCGQTGHACGSGRRGLSLHGHRGGGGPAGLGIGQRRVS